MKICVLALVLTAVALPLSAADCIPAKNSEGLFTTRGTVEMADNICPMTAGEKGDLWLRHTYSPINFVAAAATAALWQGTQNRYEGFGQGWDAYGSRFGAALANRESSDLFRTFVLSSALRMDPRYFRQGSGGFRSRLEYAVSRVVVGRTDRGRNTFNAPEIFGSLGSAGLSNLYYAQSDRTASRTIASAGLNIATDAGWNVLKEFGPELRKKLGRKKQ